MSVLHVLRRSQRLALLLVLAMAVAGCSIRTAGVDPDGVTLTASFEDVRNLVVGHAVRVSDIQVGTVTGVTLTDDFRAEVEMVMDTGTDVPAGTVAVISKTSLLGENFVALQFPREPGAVLADGAQIADTIVLPELEQVSQQAIDLLGAVVSADLDTIVDTAVEAIGGRGDELNMLLVDLGSVTGVYADRADDIGAVIDGFAAFGEDLAAGAAVTDQLIVDLNDATAAVAGQRSRVLSTLEEVQGLAGVLNDEVLVPHGDRLSRSLEQLDPVVATLADETDRLEALLEGLLLFSTNVQRAIVDGNAQVYGHVPLDGQTFPFATFLGPPR